LLPKSKDDNPRHLSNVVYEIDLLDHTSVRREPSVLKSNLKTYTPKAVAAGEKLTEA
jgi:hypothetical protein